MRTYMVDLSFGEVVPIYNEISRHLDAKVEGDGKWMKSKTAGVQLGLFGVDGVGMKIEDFLDPSIRLFAAMDRHGHKTGATLFCQDLEKLLAFLGTPAVTVTIVRDAQDVAGE